MHFNSLSSFVVIFPNYYWLFDGTSSPFFTDYEAVPPQLPAPLRLPQRSAKFILSSSISEYFESRYLISVNRFLGNTVQGRREQLSWYGVIFLRWKMRIIDYIFLEVEQGPIINPINGFLSLSKATCQLKWFLQSILDGSTAKKGCEWYHPRIY